MKLLRRLFLFATCGFYCLIGPSTVWAECYSRCSTSTYTYVCPWNDSLVYSGSTSYCVSNASSCKGVGAGGSSTRSKLGFGGSKSGGTGGYSWFGSSSSSGSGGVGCVPLQASAPCSPLSLTDSSDPCADEEKGRCDSPSAGASESVGSEVDLFGLRYYDRHTDLKLSVPGGWLAVDRRYSNGSWRMDGTEMIVPMSKDGNGYARVSLSGRIFTKTNSRLPGWKQATEDRSGTYIDEDGYILEYQLAECSPGVDCLWYYSKMVVTKPDGSWLRFSGHPNIGGFLTAIGNKDVTHLIYDRELNDTENPVLESFPVKRVLSGIEQDENGHPKVLLFYNYGTHYSYADKDWPVLESITTYDVKEVAEPDPEEGQVGVFYEYYRGENNGPDNGLLKAVTKPDGTSSFYTYNSARNLKTKTDYAANGINVLRQSSIEYHSSSLQAEDAVESSLMLGAPGGPPNPVASVAYGSGESKRFDGSYNESTGGFYSKVSYSNGSVKEVWLDDAAQLVQISLDGQVVRNIASVGRVERVTTRGNSVTIREYDEFDNLIRETLPTGHIRSWEYETHAQSLNPFTGELNPEGLDEDEDAEASEGVFTVEATRLVSMTDEIGTQTRYTYADADWGTDENGVVFNAAPYNAVRSVKTVESGNDLSRTRWEYYDRLNRLVLQIDWLGDQTAYTYKDKTTLIEQAWRPDVPDAETGLPVILYSQTFDRFGYLDIYTDAAGAVTDYDYSVAGQLLRETNPLNVSTVYTYSGDELIEMETGRFGDPEDADFRRGRITRYTYDDSGRVLKEKRVDSNEVEYLYRTYTYNNMGQMVSMTNADGLTVEYTYDVYGNRTSSSVPLPEVRVDETAATHAVTESRWNAFGDLLEETNAAGLVTRYTYDKQGRVFTVTEGVGVSGKERTLKNRYDELGNIIETIYHMSDSGKESATYTYDVFGRLTARSGYGMYAETYDYYANDSLKSVTNARGLKTTYTYDDFNRLYQVFEGDTLVATYNYDLNGNLVEQVDGEGIHVHRVYDLLNRELYISTPDLTAKTGNWWTDFANVASVTTYNRFGEVEAAQSAHGQQITYTYDDFGRLESVTYPAGATVHYEFTASDLPRRIRFPVVSTSGQGLGSEIVYTYDTANPSLVTAVQQRSGELVRNYYDNALRLARVDAPTGSVRTLQYDRFGRLISQTDYESAADFDAGQPYRTTRYTDYDDFDRLLQLTLPGNNGTQKMEYDDKGNLLSRSGSQTYPVEYTYDATGNLETMTTLYGDADPAAANTSVTHWEYDLRGRLQRKLYPDGSDIDYTYYDNNRLKTRTNAREQVTTYTYDAWGNLDRIDYPSGQSDVDYTFIKGRLQTMTDAGGSSFWTYHANSGLPASETRTTLDTAPTTIAWQYDSEGRRIRMTVNGLPGESQPWQAVYNYDRYGRLELLQDSRAHPTEAFAHGYHPTSGLLERIDSPWQQTAGENYLGEQRSYDSFGRLKRRQLNTSAATPAPIIGVNGIQYDILDRRTHVSFFGGVLYAGQKTRAFDYDIYSQLKEQSTLVDGVPKIDHAYEYDAIGNRLNWWQGAPVDPATALDTYVPNHLNQYDSIVPHDSIATVPVYDTDGNLEQQDGWNYTWDAENRLIAAEQPDTQRIEYLYDGSGRRVSKKTYDWNLTSNSYLLTTSFIYLYDGWNMIAEISDSESQIQTTKSFTWGLDLSGTLQGAGGVGGLLAVVQSDNGVNKPYFAAYDFNGNVIGYIDPATETPVAEFEYGPFGEPIRATGKKKDDLNFRFSTKYEDAETGLLYYGYRYYNAETGRWLNRDPIEEQGGLNLYGFVGNNPVGYTDLLGLDKLILTAQFRCVNGQLSILFGNTQFIEEDIFFDDVVDIPGFTEFNENGIFQNVDGSIITLDELVDFANDGGFETYDEFREAITDLGNQPALNNAYFRYLSDISNDPYSNANTRTYGRDLVNSMADSYMSSVALSFVGSAGLVIRGVPLGDGLQALNMAKDSTSAILQDGAIKDVNTPSDCCDLIKSLRKAGWFDIREMGSRIEGKFEVFNDAF